MKTTLLFVGGGLANGLAALRLRRRRPEVDFRMLESSPRLGGEHTWSFHGTDLTPDQQAWLSPLVGARWDGTEVRFPSFRRTLGGAYHAIRSPRFHDVLMSELGDRVRLNAPVTAVDAAGAVLATGERVDAGAVVDGRGWTPPAGPSLAWQKFVGLDVTLAGPHGLACPVIMDATVDQRDGYRFFYLLPWDEKRLLIEDTRYSDTPELDAAGLRAEIRAYAARAGWTIIETTREEAGALPIPLDGETSPSEAGVVRSGGRAGLFHATTGYSLPDAVRFADALAAQPTFDGRSLAAWAAAWAGAHRRSGGFFRLLNRLLFRAAEPAERRTVLEGFYRRDEALIARFYAGRLSRLDALRFFTGRPPVPLAAALGALRPRPDRRRL